MNLFIIIFFIITGIVLRYLYYWKPKTMEQFYNNTPLFFAHRGYRNKEPENTLSSFSEAIKKGAQVLEVDVLCTKDREVVCSHNYELEIQTDLSGDISGLEYSYIKTANVGHRWENKNDYIPKLIDVLRVGSEKTKFNIEIKTKKITDMLTARKVLEIIKKEKISNRVLISSFNPLVLWYIKWMDSNIRTGYLYDNPKLLFLKNIIHPDCIHPNVSLISKNLITHCRERGLRINVWTVNNKPSIHWLIKLGVDGVITDNSAFFSS